MWLNIKHDNWNVNINLELIYSIGIYHNKRTYYPYSIYINGYEILTYAHEEEAKKFIDKFFSFKYKLSQSDYGHKIIDIYELRELMEDDKLNG